ncbi:uncharacterized protein METZ01_LOCUS334853, partial [marine metagenome]
MKKRFLLLLLVIGLTSVSSADYLDDWPDDALCGWMENPSPPTYMVEEVKTRGISCSGGVAINNLPDSLDLATNDLTDSLDVESNFSAELSVNEEFLPDYPDLQKTTVDTKESWLSTYGIKPEDLSPMLLELAKETQESVPGCTSDFCFTMEPEYGEDPTSEILNKGELVNIYYRNNEPRRYVYGERSEQERNICTEDHGCFETRGYYRTATGAKDAPWVWEIEELFPLIRDGEIYTEYTEDDWLNEMDDNRLGHYRIRPTKYENGRLITDYSTNTDVNPY